MEDNTSGDPIALSLDKGVLFDILVLAGGTGRELAPLSTSCSKCLIPLCNRPLLTYCLRPWIDRGCREFFICTYDKTEVETLLRNCGEVTGLIFHIFEPSFFREKKMSAPSATSTISGGHASSKSSMTSERTGGEQHNDDEDEDDGDTELDTCDAIRSFAAFKSSMEPERPCCGNRDLLVLSCDTILANFDVEAFVSDFYRAFCTVNMLMTTYSPETAVGYEAPSVNTAVAGKGKDKEKKDKPKYFEECDVVAYEEIEDESGDVVYGAMSSSLMLSHPGIRCRRVHIIDDQKAASGETFNLTPGFVARRANLVFSPNMVDVHCYLMRHWVVDFVNQRTDLSNIRSDLIPTLALKQYWTIGDGIVVDPSSKIGYHNEIPMHWATTNHGPSPISTFNSMKENLPQCWDTLRVFATIVDPLTRGVQPGEGVSPVLDPYATPTPQSIINRTPTSLPSSATAAAGGGGAQQDMTSLSFPGRPPLPVVHTCRIMRLNTLAKYKVVTQDMLKGLGGLADPPHAQQQQQLANLRPSPFTDLLFSTGVLTEMARILASQTAAAGGYDRISNSVLLSLPPPDCTITQSVLGPNVSVGPHCRILDSVVLGNVEIAEKCVIVDSIICQGTSIQKGTKMTNCVVPPGFVIETDTYKDRQFV